MKHFKFIWALAIGALLMFASCNKEPSVDDGTLDGKELAVRLKLNFAGSDAATKAVGDRVADDAELEVTTGHIFFVDDDGKIHRHFGIGNSAGSAQFTKAEISSENGIVISGIPNVVKNCIIAMNDVESKFSSAQGITGNQEGANIDPLLTTAIPVSNINDGGGIGTVFIGGAEKVTVVGATEEILQAEATVVVVAWTSRFQIGKISAGDYTYDDGGTQRTMSIKSFKVEGIYTNNFYSDYNFSGPMEEGDLAVPTAGDTIFSDYSPSNYSSSADIYKVDGPGEKLYDEFTDITGASSEGNLLPGANDKVWAYNLFPGDNVPHFVIKLSDIKYEDSLDPGVEKTIPSQFLTLVGFKYAPTHPEYPNGPVDAIHPNQIYTLNDIKFDFSHLTDVPYQKDITATIEVTLMPWGDNEIIWAP